MIYMRHFSKRILDGIARNTLKQYNLDYLNYAPQSVPLEALIEDVFGLTIEYMHLTEKNVELGRMIYDDGYTTRYNPELADYELVKVTAGTMLIDASLLETSKLHGRYRFTLAHELAHWILHKELFTGTNAAASHCASESNDDLIEWQANYLAQAILMPAGQVKRGFYPLRMQGKNTTAIVGLLATTFGVSKQAMEIRLDDLGLA